MAFTDRCDVFGALHEQAINKIVQHVMSQRPSMFNYATQWFVDNETKLCSEIKAHPEVLKNNNPLISVEALLSVPGTNGAYGLDFCMQLTEMEIDFHPSTNITVPPELSPPLKEQSLALRAKVCVGLACPDREILDQYGSRTTSKEEVSTIQPLPFTNVNCFCLEGIAICGVERGISDGVEEVSIRLDGFEIVDIKPQGLENALECFIRTTLRLAVLSKFKLALDFLTLTIEDLAIGLALKPTPSPGTVPFNPAIVDDQLSVFLNLEVTP